MGRRKALTPSVDLHVMIPEDLHTKLSLHLYSNVDGKVPIYAYREWICERIREFFGQKRLDIAPWAGCDPGAAIVSGSPETLEILKRALTGQIPVEVEDVLR